MYQTISNIQNSLVLIRQWQYLCVISKHYSLCLNIMVIILFFFLKLTKKNVVCFSLESSFLMQLSPLWLIDSGLDSRVMGLKHQSVSCVVLPWKTSIHLSIHPFMHPSIHPSIHRQKDKKNESKKRPWVTRLMLLLTENVGKKLTVMYRSMHKLWKLYRDYYNKQILKTKPSKNSHQPSKRIKLLNETKQNK